MANIVLQGAIEAQVIGKRIINLKELLDKVVQGDDKAQVVYFKTNKIQDGLDISNYNFSITGINSNNQAVVQFAERLIDPDYPDVLWFKWEINKYFTLVSGLTDVIVTAKSPDGSVEWNTVPSEFKVKSGIRVSEYTDITDQYLQLIQEIANAAASSAASASVSASSADTSAQQALAAATRAETASLNPPYIGTNGNWYVWDKATSAFKDSGVKSRGDTGATGAQGIQGIQGVKGDTGATGARGATGATPIITGGTFTSIPNGQAPEITFTGTPENPVMSGKLPVGSTGATGAKGDKGDIGTAATIAIGTVETLAAGQAAYVSNTGTANAAIFKIGLPRGATGDKGDKGDKGDGINIAGMKPSYAQLVADFPTGNGTNSYFVPDFANPTTAPPDLYVWAGNIWKNVGKVKGVDGKDGANGLNAYQIAVMNGFVGSVAEWLVSLRGAQGVQGERGFPANVNNIAPDIDGNIVLGYGDIVGLNAQLNLKAPLANPAFTGIPTAPTAAQTINNTQIATTAFAKTAVNEALIPIQQEIAVLKEQFERVGSIEYAAITDIQANLTALVQSNKSRSPREGDLANILNVPYRPDDPESPVRTQQWNYDGANGLWDLYVDGVGGIDTSEFVTSATIGGVPVPKVGTALNIQGVKMHDVTLFASAWENKRQTITYDEPIEGARADITNGVMSDPQLVALAKASLNIIEETDNSVTLSVTGEVPTIDIPLIVVEEY